jgi:hypothetical protein
MPNAIRIDSMPITFNAGEGNQGDAPQYYKEDIKEVLDQADCVSIRAVSAIADGIEATLIIGVDAANNNLTAGNNLAAMPCPTWCKGPK